MIEVQEVGIILNGQAVLQGVSLTARPGEVTVLLGPNGSGKTTLFFCLSAHLKPRAGRIFLNGHPLEKLSRRELARRLATVPQEHHPVFPYSVRDLVLLGRLPHTGFFSQPRHHDYQVVEEILDLLHLRPVADKPYTRLSGGERQLVLIGRCLAQEPEVLLLDEPTSHLDLANQVMVLNLVRRLAQGQNLTVLMTLHDPNLALLYADQVVLLSQGKVTAQGPPAAVITAEAISALYGIKIGLMTNGRQNLIYPLI